MNIGVIWSVALDPRTFAIGDIHGCDRALRALISAIAPSRHDTLVQLGDMIDRGSGSRQVIEQLLALSKHCRVIVIRGDHEELLLAALADRSALPRWLKNGGVETLSSYGCDTSDFNRFPAAIPSSHCKFIKSSLPYFENDRFVFVHAGYVEDVPFAEQPDLALRWRVTSRATKPHCSGKTVFAGHTAQKTGDILDLGYVKCIDTNCVRGGWLTAIDVETEACWQADIFGRLRKR